MTEKPKFVTKFTLPSFFTGITYKKHLSYHCKILLVIFLYYRYCPLSVKRPCNHVRSASLNSFFKNISEKVNTKIQRGMNIKKDLTFRDEGNYVTAQSCVKWRWEDIW